MGRHGAQHHGDVPVRTPPEGARPGEHGLVGLGAHDGVDQETYDARVQWLFKIMSPRGIAPLLPETADLEVDVWLLPNLGAVNLVVHGLLGQGWTDAIATLHPAEATYTFWDYFRNRWPRNAGLRIDHLLLSPAVAPHLHAAGVDRWVRGEAGASDHAPTWIELRAQT